VKRVAVCDKQIFETEILKHHLEIGQNGNGNENCKQQKRVASYVKYKGK